MQGLDFDPSDLIDVTLEHLARPAFEEGYVGLRTKAEVDDFSRLGWAMRVEANHAAKRAVAELALITLVSNMGDELPDTRTRHEAIRLIGASPHTRFPQLTNKEHALIMTTFERDTSVEFQSAQQAHLDKLHEKRQQAEEEVSDLLTELESRKDDPAFVRAAKSWVNTPDSKKGIGEHGTGYNGGLIHFIEYRADPDKSRRFRGTNEPISVDGFIAFTLRLVRALDGEDIDLVARRAVMEDGEGTMRHYILLKNGDFIVGFQPAGWPRPKLASLITEVTERYFDTAVKGTMSGEDRGVLNQLKGNARMIHQMSI